MVTFDDVLPTMLRICETHPGFSAITKATVVRDLKGCVHLALQLPDRGTFDVDALERALVAELGPWFVGPVLGPQVSSELARLRGTVLGQNAPWRGSWVDPLVGTTHETAPGRWHRIERHLSKLAWTGTTPANLPWPLIAHRPAIVTFFSFKGGVGRTTLLASTAMQLAGDGKRVIAIDLDVEAPGLGSLLGATTRRGVVDFLVDHYATGTVDLDDLLAPATAFDRGALRIDVIPAGNVDATYFDKLARLDFVGSGLIEPAASSPVRDSLRQLIMAIARRDPPPDYILIDSRAGLHDVAGLSLHDLAHVDVLVGRDSDQSYQGLELTVAALGQRRAFDDIRCVVVQSMAPDDPGSDEYKRITAEYRRRSYVAFAAHVYERDQPGDDIPELDDDSAAHYPRIIRFDQRLLHFSSLEARRAELTGADFALVKDRIVEQCLPEVRDGSPRVTTPERPLLLQHIAALATDADAIDSPSQVFLPLDSHRLALRPEIVVVEGSRGAGKTALFHLGNELGPKIQAFFEDPSIPTASWVDAYSEHRYHPAPSVLDQLVAAIDSTNDAQLRTFWSVHLLVRLRDAGIAAARLPDEIAARYDAAPHDLTSWVALGAERIATVMTCLDAVDTALANNRQLVFASYDHLDRLGVLEQTRSTRQRLVRALVALWLSLSTRYRNLRGKIFLRPDLFEEAERSFADASKLRPRSASLEWDTGSLYRLVARHFANRGPAIPQMRGWLESAGIELVTHPGGKAFGVMPEVFSERTQRLFAKKLAGEVMGKGPKKGYTHRWIPARLKDAGGRIVPRSFLRLFEHAAREALRDPPGRGPLMEPPHLVLALKATSTDRVNELHEEYPFVGRLANLRGQTMLMAQSDVIKLLNKPVADDGFGKDGESVFEELLRIGVLEVRTDGRIDVPDIYRYGYGIKRKGGAASPR